MRPCDCRRQFNAMVGEQTAVAYQHGLLTDQGRDAQAGSVIEAFGLP